VKPLHAVLLNWQSSANGTIADYEMRPSLTLPRQISGEPAIDAADRGGPKPTLGGIPQRLRRDAAPSQQRHIAGFWLAATIAYGFVKANALAFFQDFQLLITVRNMDEDIFAAILASDEAKSLCIVIKFHNSCSHFCFSLFPVLRAASATGLGLEQFLWNVSAPYVDPASWTELLDLSTDDAE